MNSRLPPELYDADTVRQMDASAIASGISGATLMTRAAARCYAVIERRWPIAKRLLVVCGVGNNGGDGFVIARMAHRAGKDVRVLLIGDRDRIAGDARRMLDAACEAGVRIESTPVVDGQPVSLGADSFGPQLIVDALFGTGINRDVTEDAARVIEAINATPIPVLAVDVPSGLHADNGRVCGSAVRADCTVTFIAMKSGLVTGAAAAHCGELVFDSLGVPSGIYQAHQAVGALVGYEGDADLLSPRSRTAHKGHFGHVLVVGGDEGYAGAARLCGEAAARAGAGLISVCGHSSSVASIGITRPELMVKAVEAGDATGQLAAALAKASVIAMGPGLGQSPWSESVFDAVSRFARGRRLPVVLDADGLNWLSKRALESATDLDAGAVSDWIYTPHPGEAARMLDCGVSDIEADRYNAARALVARYGGTVVLKGAGTIIASEGNLGVCKHGNPGMATGGMGDVLTGVIAALVAQGLRGYAAAALGVCLHAYAADLEAANGERGLLASDLMKPIRELANPRR